MDEDGRCSRREERQNVMGAQHKQELIMGLASMWDKSIGIYLAAKWKECEQRDQTRLVPNPNLAIY